MGRTWRPRRLFPRAKGKRTQTSKFVVDLSQPVGDSILDAGAYEEFLKSMIKVNGKAGALGNAVSVSLSNAHVTVEANIPFSKRYIKYLTRKYLCKEQLRDYLRVVASSPTTYAVKYFNVSVDDE